MSPSTTDPAGIVNRAGRTNAGPFRELLVASSDDIQTLSAAVRDLVYDVFPATVEVVWPRQRSVGWGTGPRKYTEQFAYFMPHRRHVTLGFYHGGELPDPEGLLPAAGGRQVSGTLSMRSTKLTSLDDVARSALRTLIGSAVQLQLSRSVR